MNIRYKYSVTDNRGNIPINTILTEGKRFLLMTEPKINLNHL